MSVSYEYEPWVGGTQPVADNDRIKVKWPNGIERQYIGLHIHWPLLPVDGRLLWKRVPDVVVEETRDAVADVRLALSALMSLMNAKVTKDTFGKTAGYQKLRDDAWSQAHEAIALLIGYVER